MTEASTSQTHLDDKDKFLVQMYMTSCAYNWTKLPSIATKFYAAGGTLAELRGCLRHLIVLAGYGPCLAACLTLQKAKLLPEDTPGKVNGPPGNAFELVYGNLTDPVRKKVHNADAVLGEWIRLHLYGDIYSSPGLSLKQKQLLMCARLAQADMQEQLFGHALAALRFGNTKHQLYEAVEVAAQCAPFPRPDVKKESLKTIDLSEVKYLKDFSKESPCSPEVEVPDPSYVCIPSLFVSGLQGSGNVDAGPRKPRPVAASDDATIAVNSEKKDYKDIVFVWDELDQMARNEQK